MDGGLPPPIYSDQNGATDTAHNKHLQSFRWMAKPKSLVYPTDDSLDALRWVIESNQLIHSGELRAFRAAGEGIYLSVPEWMKLTSPIYLNCNGANLATSNEKIEVRE